MIVLRNVYDDDNEWVLLYVLGCYWSFMDMFIYFIVIVGWRRFGFGVLEIKEFLG